MIQAVIVEDEGVAARRLQKMLEKQGISVLKSLKSNKELSSFIDLNENPDLYFMDIHLSDGLVFETLQDNTVDVPIIFTTAYDEFAIKAFKQKSVDYLLKPIDMDELQQAIEKYRNIYEKDYNNEAIVAISKLLTSSNNEYRERIRVKIGDRLRSIKLDKVGIIYSESKITFLHTEGRSYPIDYSIDQIIEQLNPSDFHRVNRSQVVHIDHIAEVIAYSNSRLKIVIDGSSQEVIVARDRVKVFKAWFG